ncbi:DUF6356 family protein [Sphingobium chlorophenolicum]|uniref:Type 1 capsular polysaccharide biosynthesis protein J n=1 Tax=Sphingobium chlorophenolicum TaxID=46429 RepID=A0A081R8W7_SPHCR|nr:DUF6356 family protein [Sphingobium chlorophenolicum]KEQ51640.1 hypothetical protein BV95_04109 [Sphingobium chlorophenolicum]
MIDRLFLKHPRDVNESYGQHFHVATRFGFLMVRAGLACMIHGLVPALFTRTGSATVKRLYGEMRQRQPDLAERQPAYLTPQWRPEYEI